MPDILSVERLKEIYPELRGYISKFVDWSPVVRFDTNQFGIAVIPATTEFFDAVPAIGICNLERPNEVPYRMIILGFSYQLIAITGGAPTVPTIPDALVFFEECEIELEIDSDVKPSWPTNTVPGGGGINFEVSAIALGPSTSHASNGMGNQWRYYMQPIVIDPKQTFRVNLRSAGATALGAITACRISLVGIEARRPI